MKPCTNRTITCSYRRWTPEGWKTGAAGERVIMMGDVYGNVVRKPWERRMVPIEEEAVKQTWTIGEDTFKSIIEDTVAAVFERERLWREYDRLTAEWDRRSKK